MRLRTVSIKAAAGSSIVLMMVGGWMVGLGWGQESTDGDRVLHRYFDVRVLGEGGVAIPDPSTEVPEGESAEAMPRAVRPEAEAGQAPGLWLSPGEDEWILSADGPEGPTEIDEPHGALDDRGGQTELDDETDRVDHLDYQSNFEPSVVPLKRGVAQNRVGRKGGGTPVSFVESDRLRSVEFGGQVRGGQEAFWGTFLVRMEPDRLLPIPSVAPAQRVVELDSEPAIDLTVRRDEADNWYVFGDHRGLVRINMKVAVERRYFDGALDESVGWEAFEAGEGLVDDHLAGQADEFLERIGVSARQKTPLEALERLVEHYRDFEVRPVSEIGGENRYLDLSLQQVGVCRHRSLGFMISAWALGIPTRYVYNEAHAFVEVEWPGQGWRRIDLGGAADEFEYQNHRGGGVHDGLWDDEFPLPDSYEEEMAQRSEADDVETSSPQQDDRNHEAIEEEPSPHELASEGEVGESQRDGSSPSEVELLEADGDVFRGGEVTVQGRVDDGAPGTQVEVLLVPSGAKGTDGGVEVGATRLGDDGRFEETWTIPDDVSLGRWRLRGRVVDR